MRRIPQAAIDLVKSKETCVLFVYDDAHYPPRRLGPGDVIKGKLTGGWGHTGTNININTVVSQALADSWLDGDLSEAAFRLEAHTSKEIIGLLTDNQYAAMIDFVFNVGAGAKWTIWKRLNAKQFDQVPLELAKFVNQTLADGTVVKRTNLVERRNLEIALWAQGEPGTDDVVMPSSATRAAITPPTPADPVPATKSKAIIAGVGGAIAAGPPMVNQITQAITPYAAQSDYVKHLLGILATIGAVLAAVGLVYMFIQKRNARN